MEIEDYLKKTDIRAAASLLRYYLEHVFREICDNLQARVEFRGDGRYELGDLLPPAVKRFRSLILEGKKVAEVWGNTGLANELGQKEKEIGEAIIATNAEQWQINPALHYNEWATLTSRDFAHAVTAFPKSCPKILL